MKPPHVIDVTVLDPSDAGKRLDVFLADRLGLFSRSQARTRVLGVTVNGAPVRLARRVRLGDALSITYSDPPPTDLQPEDIPLTILFENDDVLVIDKQQGLVVHPGSGNPSGTLVNAVLHHCRGIASGFDRDDPRPGIVHRLDKETSGVIIVAKNPRAHEHLAAQFSGRTVRKRYLAIVQGRLPAGEGTVDARLARDPRNRKLFACVLSGGRSALTRYHVLRSFEAGSHAYALVLLAPRTGRTHQLRAHMRHLRTPILGDPLYGRPDPLFPDATLMLHARSLRIRLPGEDQQRAFVAALPERFRSVLREIQSFSPRKGL